MSASIAYTVILDMDGTLLDLNFDDQVWNYALPAALAARDGDSVEAARLRVAETLGSVRGTLPWDCHDHWEREFGISVHELEIELAHFIDLRAGTLDFLKFTQANAYRTILATNAHPVSLERKMVRTGLRHYFSAVISAHSLGAAKEDPLFWTQLVATERVDPGLAILVDDNPAVLATAHRFGVRHVFGVRTPSSTGLPKSFPEFASVESLAELIPWLSAGVN